MFSYFFVQDVVSAINVRSRSIVCDRFPCFVRFVLYHIFMSDKW